MTVEALIEQLQKFPKSSQVLIQKTSEDNACKLLCRVEGNAMYREVSNDFGTIVYPEWSATDAGFESEEAWGRFKADNGRWCVLIPLG